MSTQPTPQPKPPILPLRTALLILLSLNPPALFLRDRSGPAAGSRKAL